MLRDNLKQRVDLIKHFTMLSGHRDHNLKLRMAFKPLDHGGYLDRLGPRPVDHHDPLDCLTSHWTSRNPNHHCSVGDVPYNACTATHDDASAHGQSVEHNRRDPDQGRTMDHTVAGNGRARVHADEVAQHCVVAYGRIRIQVDVASQRDVGRNPGAGQQIMPSPTATPDPSVASGWIRVAASKPAASRRSAIDSRTRGEPMPTTYLGLRDRPSVSIEPRGLISRSSSRSRLSLPGCVVHHP